MLSTRKIVIIKPDKNNPDIFKALLLTVFLKDGHCEQGERADSPVVPVGQLVHTTSCVVGTTAQLEPPGHGQGWQSEEVPAVGSP